MLRPLLIPLTLVCLHILLEIPQAKCQPQLGMMPDAFDDQYIGCEKEMDERVTELLEKEKCLSPLFNEAWENSKKKWKTVKTSSLPRDFKEEHGRAITAYTDQQFHKLFLDIENKSYTSREEYMANFHFKALHYYLTRALRLLRGRCDVIHNHTVYRGVTGIQYGYPGSGFIRFGHFASSSLDKQQAVEFGTDSFFTIHTCFGVNISAFSHNPKQQEVLIPVHEKFSVLEQGNHRFSLQSTNQTCSHFNCAYLKEQKRLSCVDNSATRRGITLPIKMSPSLFGGSTFLIHIAALKLFVIF